MTTSLYAGLLNEKIRDAAAISSEHCECSSHCGSQFVTESWDETNFERNVTLIVDRETYLQREWEDDPYFLPLGDGFFAQIMEVSKVDGGARIRCEVIDRNW